MDILFELIFEIILEGCFELISTPKLPKPLRILAFIFFTLVYGTMLVVIGMSAWSMIKDANIALSILLIVVEILLVGCIIYAIRKRRNA